MSPNQKSPAEPKNPATMRIVSLLPSATEIVCELGLIDQLVGVTHECDYPPRVIELPKVTRTLIPHDASSLEIDSLVRERLKTNKALYTLDLPTLERLKPDLLVTQALCDVCAVSEDEVNAAACSLPGFPRVINLEPMRLTEVFDCLMLVGQAAGVPAKAEQAVVALKRRVEIVATRTETITDRPKMILLEWIDPPFCAGHWSPELVRLAGGIEGIGKDGQRSRTMHWDEVISYDPDVLVIACCGFSTKRTLDDLPILRRYPHFADLTCVRNDRVYIVDGNAYFSRPGPRLVDSLEILANILHPEVHPLPENLSPAYRVS